MRHLPSILARIGLNLLAAFIAAVASHAQTSAGAACLNCHRAIVQSYGQTPMARGSGPATDGALTGSFDHAQSGVRYAIQSTGSGDLLLRYTRAGAQPLNGIRRLEYFVGSGKRGRTYLFQTDGYWFQSPIDFYTRNNIWEMAPGYSATHQVPIDLRVDEGCLSCHSSGVRPSSPGSTNRFGARPFAQGGITCDRCHGDSTAHVASGGKSAILNPARLEPARRDAVCQQCHLEGETAVLLPGRHSTSFQPGDDLFANVAYFAHSPGSSPGVRAVSQVEALQQSVCKQKSGDRMSCTSCHDPHRTIPASNKAAFYRERCLACHTGSAFRKTHHIEQPDCTTCHMPTRTTTDIAHEQATDHRIPRRPLPNADDPDAGIFDEPSSKLVPILGSHHGARELGLAYAAFARKGDLFSLAESVRLLRAANTELPADPSVTFTLADLYDAQGDRQSAESLYRRVYTIDPAYPGVAARLGDQASQSGDRSAAIALWTAALTVDTADAALAQRLAAALCSAGRRTAAVDTLRRAVPFLADSTAVQATMLRWQTYVATGCASASLTP